MLDFSDADLEHFAVQARRLRDESDRAIVATFGGTAFGDIALVPAPWLKNPKGIRDVEEGDLNGCLDGWSHEMHGVRAKDDEVSATGLDMPSGLDHLFGIFEVQIRVQTAHNMDFIQAVRYCRGSVGRHSSSFYADGIQR